MMAEPAIYSMDTSGMIDGLERHYRPSSFPGLWLVTLILFMWMHIPEPTITEIMRGLESRS